MGAAAIRRSAWTAANPLRRRKMDERDQLIADLREQVEQLTETVERLQEENDRLYDQLSDNPSD
jgi:archaellum component FlaC